MERISAVIGTLNEAHNIRACIEAVQGVDEVIVCDDGSTDNTVTIAKECGAKVYRRKDWTSRATGKDVTAFEDRFGWLPSFEHGSRIRNGAKESQENLSYANNDWVVVPDADERVTWNLPYLHEIVLPQADQISCDFVHSHDVDGNPEGIMRITKLFRRSKTEIVGRTHTAIIPNGVVNYTKRMRVDHWQRPGHTQSYVLPILEYSVIVDDDPRSRFYLGREYYYKHEYDRAIRLFTDYLTVASWMPEIGQARLYLSACYWYSGRGDSAREQCREAVLINPQHKEALLMMAELYYEPWRHKWLEAAESATNEDVLFPM